MLATLEVLGMVSAYTVTLMVGTNDVSRGEARKVTRLHDKMSCILEEIRIQMDPAILMVCTVPYNMGADQHAVEMNNKVRSLNETIRKIHQRSVLPLRLLDVAEQMELSSFPDDASADGIHFDRPRGVEWLNNVFQRHICALEAELLETAQVTFGPPPNPPFYNPRSLSSRLGERADSRDSSRNSRTKLPSTAPMEADEATSATPQRSIMSSVVVAEKKRAEKPLETSRSKYEEKVKELDLEDLECRLELARTLGLEQVSHEDLGRHQCVDWLKAHETHFSRAKRMEPGSCLDSTCGNGEHTCDGRSCVRIQSFQKEDLITWFEDITEREKSEIQIVAECYASTTVNLATALGFFSRICSLQSLERLESEHHLVTALSVESWPGVLQVNQKHIKSLKIGLEAEMGFPMSEAYGLPLNAKSLVGSVLANLCGSHYPLHMAMVEVSSQRVLIDKAFSVPKCVRLARMSHHSHKLLRKIRGAVPKEQRDDLSEIWGEELQGMESENTSDHGRQNVVGKPAVGAPSSEEVDVIHEKMMELEPLLEASGERNLRSIDLTHGDCPCHCLAQTVWYPDRANLCLIWDIEEIKLLGLPEHRQKVTILVVSTMLALRWMEENIAKYRESRAPTAESIHAIDYSRRLELFETACKIFAIPVEIRHI